MLEFEVQDVNAEYTRLRELKDLTIEFVMSPRDLPWGNRSIYFRDPDGNLINFFSRRSMTALRVRGLHKAFGVESVLCGLDLDLPVGTLTAVLGPSGSGKLLCCG